jgi:transcriptional regulator with XRE-family HTH domain
LNYFQYYVILPLGDNKMTIYDRIKALRISQQMSQTDLALKMGYKDGSMITKIESGKVDISQKKIVAFAKALDTTPAYLMGWTEDPPDDPLQNVPVTSEARILAKGIDKLPQEQRKQALNVIRAMFAQNADYFNKENDDET